MAKKIIDGYKRRALDLRISMTDLCAEAGIAASTFSRWGSGAYPRVSNLKKVDAALDRLEAKARAK